MYKIVPEVCQAIYEALSPIFLKFPTAEEWKIISKNLYDKTNFPNSLGPVDTKQIRIKCPANSGSFFINFKKFFSIALMASCDAYCRITWFNLGGYGKLHLLK